MANDGRSVSLLSKYEKGLGGELIYVPGSAEPDNVTGA